MRHNKIMAFILTLVTTVTMCAPGTAFASPISVINVNNEFEETENNWRDNIDVMLEGKVYKEGQVIAVVKNSFKKPTGLYLDKYSPTKEVTELSDFSAETVEEICGEESIRVEIIEDESKTTREILMELAKDPSVIDATPNYEENVSELSDEVFAIDTTELTEAFENKLSQKTTEEVDFSNEFFEVPYGNEAGQIGDYSFMQWAYEGDNNGVETDIWDEKGETNVNVVNEEPYVIVVMDSGIDYTHPDLAPVLMDNMQEYSALGGNYGYNATDDAKADDPVDENSHGTHCAGIIAAAWDDVGISGIASGVKLCAVRIADEKGSIYTASTLKGYAYILDAISNGLNVIAINESYGGAGGMAERLYIEELNKKGVIVARAAGNESENNDYNAADASSLTDSDNVFVVNSSNAYGLSSDYTCYGLNNTDLYAPGEGILSTVCESESSYFPFENPDGQKFYYGFSPEVETTKSAKITANNYTIESVYIEDNALDNDGYAGKIVLQPHESKNLFLYIPIEDIDLTEVSLAGISCKADNVGSFFMQSLLTNGSVVKTSINYGAARTSNKWSTLTYKFCENSIPDGYRYLIDDGHLVMYIQAINKSDKVNTFYVDSIGLGNEVSRYGYKSGTSMATPAVTGAIAIAVSNLSENDYFNNLEKEKKPAYIKEYILNAVTPVEEFAGKCGSGGILNVSNFGNNDNVGITDIVKEDDKLIITGKNFGVGIHRKPAVFLNEIECKVISWSDKKITVMLPDKTESGVHTIAVMAGDETGYALKKVMLKTEYGIQEFEKDLEYNNISDRYSSELVGENGIIYIFNNENGFNSYSSFRIYNTITGEYGDSVMLPKGEEQDGKIIYLSAAISNDLMVIYTNYLSGNLIKASIFLYDVIKKQFVELDMGDYELPVKAAVTIMNNRVILHSGVYMNGVTLDNYKTTDSQIEINNYIVDIPFAYDEANGTAIGNARNVIQKSNFIIDNDLLLLIYQLENFAGKISARENKFVILDGNQIDWYEWDSSYTEPTKKYHLDIEQVFGTTNSEVEMLSGVLTPKGYVLTGIAMEEYDTVLIQEDGTIEPLDRRLSYGPLYLTKSCYLDNCFYAYGYSTYDFSAFLRGTSIEKYKDVIKHDLKKVEAVEPTTTKEGHTAYYECTCCGQIFTDANAENKTSKKNCIIGRKIVSIKNISDGLQITWNKVEGATRYQVLRCKNGGSWTTGWTKVAETTKTTFVDKTVVADTTYEYTIVPYYGETKGTRFINYKTKRILPPKTVTATAVSKGVNVSWTKVNGTTKYQIFRRKVGNGWSTGWTWIKDTKSTNYIDTTAKKGDKYVYCVKVIEGSYQSYITSSKEVKYK